MPFCELPWRLAGIPTVAAISRNLTFHSFRISGPTSQDRCVLQRHHTHCGEGLFSCDRLG